MSDYKDDLKEALDEMENQILEEVEEVETKFDKLKRHMKNFYNENKCLFHFAGGLVVGVLLTEALSKDKVIPVIVEEPLKMLEKKLTSDTLITFDLAKLEKQKVAVSNLKDEEGKVFGEKIVVWYKHKEDNGNTTWVTIKEQILNKNSYLKYNAKEYEKYVEEQSKKLLDDTKK